jgi:hypothetical protein
VLADRFLKHTLLIESSEIVNSIERLQLEICARVTPKKTANDCAVQVIVRLKFYFHREERD